MPTRISDILRQNVVYGKVDNSKKGYLPISHVSMIQPCGKFHITGDELNNFWDIYQQDIFEGKGCYGLAEVSNSEYRPILGDIDLKVPETDNIDINDTELSLYSNKQLMGVISIFNNVLRKMVDGLKEEDLVCIYLSKKPYIKVDTSGNRSVKHGFHLHYPKIIMSKNVQEVLFIPFVKEEMKKANIFSNYMEDSSSVIDSAVVTVPWLLYGSKKTADSEPYTVNCCYNNDLEKISLWDALKSIKIYNIFGKKINLTKDNITYNTPLILSVNTSGRETVQIVDGLESPIKNRVKCKTVKKRNNDKNNENPTELLKKARVLLNMVDDSRADDRGEWLMIGWILFNFGDESGEAFDLWDDFSKRSSKYDANICISQWDKMEYRDITIATLMYYANQDNPTKYLEWRREINKDNKKSVAEYSNHNDIARMLYNDYGELYKNTKGNVWYYFYNHKWTEIEDGYSLREKLSTDVWDYYEKQRKDTFKQMHECSTADSEEDRLGKLQTKLCKLLNNLKTAPFKSNVMKEAREVFYDPKFHENLNQNPMLICFNNGVYDFELDEFRPGRPEDKLSKSLSIDYIEFSPDSKEVEEVDIFFKKIFPDESVRTYFLNHYCDLFIGGNLQKKIHFWIGEGDNGKSVTQNLFEKMLGQLSVKFDTTLFTGKKTNLGSAAPELARAAAPVRHAVLEEPDNDEQLNIGYLKKLSGNDTYFARDLFQAGKDVREIKPMFEMTFICNKLPPLKKSDKATWNRIRVIPFESTFADNCPETFEEQMRQKIFPIDREFDQKIPKMIEALAWFLIEWRKRRQTISEPSKVKQATKRYEAENDLLSEYLEESIINMEGSVLHLNEVYNHFKEWYKNAYPSHCNVTRNEIKSYLIKHWGTPETKILQWKNVAFAEEGDW